MSESAVFGPAYADSYDHFYVDKDYAAECDFLEEVMRRYAAGPVRTILDLGCGTGGHALLLARRGYEITAVDRSEEMLRIAQAKAAVNGQQPAVFHQGDIRTLDLGQTFDVVTAMFAVMGYMLSNEDLASALRSARRHVAPGGILIFDAWFGPGVLSDRPSDRYKLIEVNGERIVRFAHTEMDVISHTAAVHYHVLRLRNNQIAGETREVHRMRYLFPQEIAYFLSTCGFGIELLCPFPRIDQALTDQHWNFSVVARAKE
jgi:predicted TPR repeat methyltransferase